MRESSFWETIRDNTKALVDWTRIENQAGAGIPDVTGCHDGIDAWVELKVMHGRQIEIQFSQVRWMTSRIRAGAKNIFFVVRGPRTIKAWRAKSVLLYCKRGHETETSHFVTPPPAEFECNLRDDWAFLLDFVFPGRRGRSDFQKSS